MKNYLALGRAPGARTHRFDPAAWRRVDGEVRSIPQKIPVKTMLAHVEVQSDESADWILCDI